jgi:hypothetical protein
MSSLNQALKTKLKGGEVTLKMPGEDDPDMLVPTQNKSNSNTADWNTRSAESNLTKPQIALQGLQWRTP